MKRTAIYAHAYSCKCDWCGDRIPSCGGGGYDYRPGHDPNMIKFVSPIDGNYVRARLCATHLEKIKRLMETAA